MMLTVCVCARYALKVSLVSALSPLAVKPRCVELSCLGFNYVDVIAFVVNFDIRYNSVFYIAVLVI